MEKTTFAKVHFSSANPLWRTPNYLYQELDKEFNFDYDPCPTDPQLNGLTTEWGKRNFVNPPYGRNLIKWIKKAYEESQKNKLVVLLIPSRTDTKWFHEICIKGEIRFIKGRIKFEGAKHNAPFPSMIVIFREVK